jgi:hypothetical protein
VRLAEEMMDNIRLIALSGFHSPDINPTELGTVHPAVVICAGDVNVTMAHTAQEFNITVHSNFPPFNPTTPYGVRVSIPLNNLASIFFLDHGNNGRSIRIRLISLTQAFKLNQFATIPAHKRHMLDELGRPVLLYPWYQNDHFDLMGILQSREVVGQVSSSISMEELVDWGVRLKEATAALDGTIVQVLFDNIETGRVSQLETILVPGQKCMSISETTYKGATGLRDHGHSETNRHIPHQSHRTTQSLYSEASFGIPTPPLSNGQRPSSVHTASTDRLDDEDYWTHRHRVLRPQSPRRYYRPEKRKLPAREDKQKSKDKSPRKRLSRKREQRKRDEGRLTRPSTSEIKSRKSKEVLMGGDASKPEVLLEVAVVK